MACMHGSEIQCGQCRTGLKAPSGMTWEQTAWSAGWAEGYQAGMKAAFEANESEIARLQNERDELRACLRWYVENDDTMGGGRWEEANEPWLAGKRRAMRALGINAGDE